MASRRHRRIRWGLALFWIVATAWMFLNMQARGVDPAVLESDSRVRVSSSSTAIRFTPTGEAADAALAFYPGALADPEAYTPMAREVAEAGFEVVILKLPYRLANLQRHEEELARRTVSLIEGDEHRRAWVLGGHSRGGALAARFACDHAPLLAGLLLVATSHPRRDDLSGLELDVVKIYGTEDGLASEAEIQQFAGNLPESTRWVRVEGANHARFAWYGWQLGDGTARLSRREQQAATVKAILEQLRRVSGPPFPL